MGLLGVIAILVGLSWSYSYYVNNTGTTTDVTHGGDFSQLLARD